MKARIYSLSLLFACCMTVMAIAPQKRANVKELKSDKGTIMVSNQQKAVAATALEEGLIYEEDFEDAANTWTLFQTEGQSESAYGLYVASKVESSTGTMPAAHGSMYMVADYDPYAVVDQWAISKGVELQAGTTYWVSAFCIATEDYGNEDFKITMGTSASKAAQTTVLIDNTGDNFQCYNEWTLLKGTFTVPADGTYFFGYNHVAGADQFYAAMDYFRITTNEPQNPKPIITGARSVVHYGAWSLDQDNPELYLPTDSAEAAINVTSNFTEDYKWTVTNATATYPDTTDVMTIEVPASANVTLAVKCANAEGDTTAQWNVAANVKTVAGTTDVLSNIAPNEEPNSYGYNVSKLYKMSYAEGYNHLDIDETAHINNVKFAIYEAYFEDYADSLISVRILGGKVTQDFDGYDILIPDDTKEFGRKELSVKAFLGDENAYIEKPGKNVEVAFDVPVNVTGTYFIAVDLMQVDTLQFSLDNNYISFYNVDRGNGSGVPVSYWLPYTTYKSWNDADGWVNEGEYYRALFYQAFGVDYTYPTSLCFFPEVTFGPYVNINNVKADSKLSIYPTPAKDVLYVENLNANATVAIMDVMGRTVANYVAAGVQNGISLKGLAEGIYVVSVKDAAGVHTAKFVKE